MTATNTLTAATGINGLSAAGLHELIENVQADARNAQTNWRTTSRWVGGTVSEHAVDSCEIGGRRIPRSFSFRVDEPVELGGTNRFANPQEYLLGALNACMMVGYVALASLEGITLESVEIESGGDIDLRGFLGLDPSVKAGYERVHYTVRIKGDGTPEQFERIHRTVMATSPNRFNIANPVTLTSDLIVG